MDPSLSPTLPAFGALCSRVAIQLGLEAQRWASPAQQAWSIVAKEVFASMREGAAPMEDMHFVAYDERPLMAWLDRMIDGKLGQPVLNFAEPSMLGRSSFRFMGLERPDAPPAFGHVYETLVCVREGRKDEPLWREICGAFDSDRFARAFVIGHEAAHSLFAKEHWATVKNALLATKTELGARASADVQEFELSLGAKDRPHERSLTMAVEEALCDAVGCWAASRLGCVDSPQRVRKLRQNLAGGSRPEYLTGWMIGDLPSELGQWDFEQLSQAMLSSCKNHGADLALKIVNPAPRKPAEQDGLSTATSSGRLDKNRMTMFRSISAWAQRLALRSAKPQPSPSGKSSFFKGLGEALFKTDQVRLPKLSRAALAGNVAEVKRLIARGASVNERESMYGATALTFATRHADTQCLSALLTAGVEVNIQSMGGSTALTVAIGWQNAAAIKMLVDAGADLDLKDSQGLGSVSAAVIAGAPDMVGALAQLGASPPSPEEFQTLGRLAQSPDQRQALQAALSCQEALELATSCSQLPSRLRAQL